MPESSCLGCQLANKEIETNTIYENDLLTCILDIAPLNEGHILILPKLHYHDVDDLDEITANEIMKTSRLLARLLKSHFQPDGVTILQNNGKFNDLTHYHMHIFPRYDSDGFALVEPLDSTNAKGRIKETTAKLVELINRSIYANGKR
ncbi:histidine triad (HIT) family protein [Paenibacillus sp. V4I3]|uniref:HIT family protein n=1 Tax=Paenibacillus sp. V4I3 TaxID=3042305 RepID=UPI002783F76D|nr:HIT family protein [Paenibacillus sp. V4I3]MDQ0876062.1 histidine triad (HIT) family protein [Paenibacillus sp. V4I3]